MNTFDSLGARQQPVEELRIAVDLDLYNQPVFIGDNVVEFENGDKVQLSEFKNYVDNLPESELIEFMGGSIREVVA